MKGVLPEKPPGPSSLARAGRGKRHPLLSGNSPLPHGHATFSGAWGDLPRASQLLRVPRTPFFLAHPKVQSRSLSATEMPRVPPTQTFKNIKCKRN